jgi:hypothetical protein
MAKAIEALSRRQIKVSPRISSALARSQNICQVNPSSKVHEHDFSLWARAQISQLSLFFAFRQHEKRIKSAPTRAKNTQPA